jgi:microsomal dipeptidase-like Zn-dependent dipeptidase
LSKIHYSITTDEYAYADSKKVKNFYPLSINLYDEEIATICKLKGIIGITLEQRMLGSYMNNATNYGKKKSDKKREDEILYFLDSLKNAGALDSLLTMIKREASRPPYRYSSLTSEQAYKILCKDYLSAEPFLQNVFHLVDHSGVGNKAWNHLCIGSDMDGFLDPIDIVPTATQYPYFKNRLRQIIPIYLHQRSGSPDNWKRYFENKENLAECLNLLFYESLRKFVVKWFKK